MQFQKVMTRKAKGKQVDECKLENIVKYADREVNITLEEMQ